MAQTFMDFFDGKIHELRENFPDVPLSESCPPTTHTFTDFALATEDSVTKLILSMNFKSCSLDPIPTKFLKVCLPEVVSDLVAFVNTSVSTATVPSLYKHAVVRPLLKKPGLDPEVLKNYRPVSNLCFEHKFLERFVFNQLDLYFTQFDLYSKFPSAYRRDHSTETALLRVRNDVLEALDARKQVLLVLLDLTAAFDTIDHDILLHRLERRFGICGPALNWISSYLRDRTQCVSIDGCCS